VVLKGQYTKNKVRARDWAFTLLEVMLTVGLMGIMVVTLYAGLSYGFAQIQLSREDQRATQILAERMEVVRLVNWDQLVNLPGYVPTHFTASYSVQDPTHASAGSMIYSGDVLVTNAPVSESYAGDLRLIQISLSWQSGQLTHRRTMSTFVSRHGLQRFVY
jgi:type II secretory pathway pseudopilin PulG